LREKNYLTQEEQDEITGWVLKKTSYSLKLAKFILLISLLLIFFWLKTYRGIRGVNPAFPCVKDYILDTRIMDSGNGGIWNSLIIRTSLQIISSLVIDIPVLMIFLNW